MHIGRIIHRKNFHVSEIDKYLMETLETEVFINEGESANEAVKMARDFNIEQAKTLMQLSDHSHIEERSLYSTPERLPDIQIEKAQLFTDYNVVVEEINKCQTIADLDGWNMIAKGNHDAGMAFAKKAAQLLSPKNN